MSPPFSASGPTFDLWTLRSVLVVAGLGALSAACSSAPSDRQWDVGSMALPQPLPQGDLSTTASSFRLPSDTGSMAYPQPVQAGEVRRAVVSRAVSDTGSMAYPAPLPVGNGPAIQIK